MRYIKQVNLVNFQSHKDTTIDFNEKLNVIVGQSDSGKTAILRGIRWALYNEPSGDYFIREGENHCSVTIVFSDGIKVKRYRSKSKNIYYLYDNDNNEMTFEGFGTKVPEEIIYKTGIEKILLDNNLSKAINIGDQLEGPFLLSEMASTKANAIGRIVGVDLIDDTLRDTLRDSKNLNQQKKLKGINLENINEELKKYDYLDELKEKVFKLEKIEKDISNRENKLRIYREFLDKYIYIEKEKILLIENLERLGNIDILEKNILYLENKIQKSNELIKMNNKLLTMRNNIEHDNKILIQTKDIGKIDRNLINIQNKSALLKNYHEVLNKYNYVLENKLKVNSYLKDFEKLKSIDGIIQVVESNMINFYNILDKGKELTNIKKSKIIGQDYLNKFKFIQDIDLKKIDELIIKHAKLNETLLSYNVLKNNKKNITLDLDSIDENLNLSLKKYREVLLESKSCPICSTELNNDKIEEIVKEYV